MSLKFNTSNVKNENPMFCKKFFIWGDGESVVIRIALDKSPVAMTFIGGNKPVYALLRQANCDTFISVEDGILKFEFPEPPGDGERIEVDVEFFYEGESYGQAS